MTNTLHQRKIDRIIEAEFGAKKRLVVEIDAEIDGTTTGVLTRALRQAARGGLVDLGPGSFKGFVVDRKSEVSSREMGLTEVEGTIRCTAGPVLLRGLVIRAQSKDSPAIEASAGTVILVDCEIHGGVDTAKGARVLMRNCLVVGGGVAWTLDTESEGEAVACRFSGSPAGVFVAKGATCALFTCRVEGCKGNAESSQGAGLYASYADVHMEGVEFFGNEIGLYLKSCGESSVVACHFHGNTTAGIITEEAAANRNLRILGCRFDSIDGMAVAPMAFHGGSVHLFRTRAYSRDAVVSTSQTSLRIEDSEFRSEEGAALDLQGGSLSCARSRLQSQKSPAVIGDGCPGEIVGGTLLGNPPVSEKGPAQIKTRDLESTPDGQPPQSIGAQDEVTLEASLEFLDKIIGQGEAKKELGRLIRLAFATRQRRLQKMPPRELNFSGVIVGPQGSGKAHAMKNFAEALHFLGELPTPNVCEISLAEAISAQSAPTEEGILLIDTHSPEMISLASPEVLESLMRLARGTRAHLMLDGEKHTLQAVMRSRPELSREFPIELNFQSFGPPELAALFAEHCKSHGIRVSLDAARALPVIMHGLHDRLHRRFTDTDGIAELFEEAHRNYLERCSREGRFNLELERDDIVVSLDRFTLAVLGRSADLVAVCPSCGAENPWLPGLGPKFHCLQCGEPFTTQFGTMKNSTFFRKRTSKGLGVRSGAVAMRRTLADAMRPRR